MSKYGFEESGATPDLFPQTPLRSRVLVALARFGATVVHTKEGFVRQVSVAQRPIAPRDLPRSARGLLLAYQCAESQYVLKLVEDVTTQAGATNESTTVEFLYHYPTERGSCADGVIYTLSPGEGGVTPFRTFFTSDGQVSAKEDVGDMRPGFSYEELTEIDAAITKTWPELGTA